MKLRGVSVMKQKAAKFGALGASTSAALHCADHQTSKNTPKHRVFP
jgi:hypothetical protein